MAPSVDPKWIRGSIDELAIERGCYFSQDAADWTITFLERYCKQSKDPWHGQPLKLLPWQIDFLSRLYGWLNEDGTRRYRKAYLEVAKKNGKSTLVSGLGLYHLVADGEKAPECYLNACDRGQARIVFDEAMRMVEASPDLLRKLDLVPSQARIVYEREHGVLKAQSKDTPGKDGLNSSLTIFDELHRQPNSDMWRVYRHAGATRRQPLILSITTAGYDRESVCYREHEYTKGVNAGTIKDITHLGVIFGAEPDDDIHDPATWRKANPSLGVTISEAGFAQALQEAIDLPTELNEFLRLRLCLWTNASERLIPRDKWDACGKEPIDLASLAGQRCFGGLDLASTEDLAAFVAIFPRPEGGFAVVPRFWCPEAYIDDLEKRTKAPYRLWVAKGYLKATPGFTIDYEQIKEEVVAFGRHHRLKRIICDQWGAQKLAPELVKLGFKTETMGQGFASFTWPTRELLRLVLSGRLQHGNHPIMNWCADNCQAVKGDNGAIRISKSKSTGKIDGIAALVDAIAGTLGNEDDESIYETRDLLVF